MKRFLTILLLVIFAAGSVLAQQKEPMMNFSKTTHDFGNIKQENGPAKVTFEFTNTGGSPVIITNVSASCGCTTPNWSKQPIPPGGKGVIDVAYDPVNRPGQFTKDITVTSNAANSPVVLKISGNVLEKQASFQDTYPQTIGDLRLDKNFINYGNIFNNESKTMTIKIYNPLNRDLTVKAEQNYNNSPYLTVKIEPEILKPGKEGTIYVTYNAALVNDWDYVRANILLTIDGVPQTSKPIQVSAIVKEFFTEKQKQNPPKIVFENTTFDFDTINEGDVVDYIFKFKNEGTSDLIIRKTSTTCGCTAVSLTNEPVAPGKTGEIKVSFNSSHKPNAQNKTVTIITNCPDDTMNKMMLRISGFVKPKQQ